MASESSWGLVARSILAQRDELCPAMMKAKLNSRAPAHCYGWALVRMARVFGNNAYVEAKLSGSDFGSI
jgi:hypothetical protein